MNLHSEERREDPVGWGSGGFFARAPLAKRAKACATITVYIISLSWQAGHGAHAQRGGVLIPEGGRL